MRKDLQQWHRKRRGQVVEVVSFHCFLHPNYRVRNNWQELVFNIYLFFPITLKVYIGDQCQDRPILNKKYKIHFSF